MSCTDARNLIHLDVGNDLHAEEQSQLAAHMEQCSECRSYQGRMLSAMSVLSSLRDEPSLIGGNATGNSVWPALSREIKRRSLSPRAVRKFNLQIVALSVCSLSLAVVTMVQSLSSMRNDDYSANFVPAQSVTNSQSGQRTQYPLLQQDMRFRAASDQRTPMLPHELPGSMPQSF